jgi:CubicO group peptidase (beta-lactamase class C family)
VSATLLLAAALSIFAKVDAYVKPYVDLRTFSGAILIGKGSEVLFAKAYGLSNVELNVANARDTKFHLASVSKTFTAAAVMLLQERGLLDVNDPVAKYLPGFPNGDKILIRHLLTDTSGLPNINNMPEYEREVKLPHTLDEVIAMFRGKPLAFEPGSRAFSESSANWVLAAKIIEIVSHRTYGDFMRAEIFEPAGLKNTGHHGDMQQVIPNRAYGYAPAGYLELEDATYIDWSFKTGNASLYSTVDDLFRWQRVLADGKLLPRATVDTMWREQYGWFRSKRHNRDVARYNGRAPGFQCEIQRYHADDVFVAVLSNNYSTAASLIVDDIAAIALGEPYKIPSIRVDVKADPSVLASYTGTYVFGPDFYVPNARGTVEVVDGKLMRSSGGITGALIPQADGTFFDRGFWATVKFEKDSFTWTYGDRSFRANRVAP